MNSTNCKHTMAGLRPVMTVMVPRPTCASLHPPTHPQAHARLCAVDSLLAPGPPTVRKFVTPTVVTCGHMDLCRMELAEEAITHQQSYLGRDCCSGQAV